MQSDEERLVSCWGRAFLLFGGVGTAPFSMKRAGRSVCYDARMREVAIIGGGAGGLAAAVAAARGGAHVTVYEQKDSVGKSILVSGNGRCNLSNLHIDAGCYRNHTFVSRAFEVLSPDRVHAFFRDLGLVMVDGGAGRLYPATNKAQTVLRVLQVELAGLPVDVVCRRMVKRVVRRKGSDGVGGNRSLGAGADAKRAAAAAGKVATQAHPGAAVGSNAESKRSAAVDGKNGTEAWSCGAKAGAPALALEFMDGSRARCDAVIVAAGGLAPAQLLDVELPYARPRGRLCAIKTDLPSAEGLDKVRTRCTATLMDHDGRVKAVERGEAQFRSFGLSGIAAFNLSRFASEGDTLSLDVVPERSRDELAAELAQSAARHPWRAAIDVLAGYALEPVAQAALRQAGIRADKPLDAPAASRAAGALKGYRMTVRALDDRHAQVHRGGFAVESFNPASLEARGLPGVHVIGEALDVDGPCGGFNLHWAWTTGLLAGAHAAVASIDRVLAE